MTPGQELFFWKERAEQAEAKALKLTERCGAYREALAAYQDPDWTKNPPTARSQKNAEDAWELGEIKERYQEALENLFAMVQGECPSLLEDHHLYDKIKAALASPAGEQKDKGETFGEFCERIYQETGGVTPELRRAYEFYRANYRGEAAGEQKDKTT